ncbi:hypothetical protein CR513_41747, partial [Mucuna pruriens]
MPPQGNLLSLEDLMKQLATSNLEFQQNMNSIPTKHEHHHPKPQDANRTASNHYEPFIVGWVRVPEDVQKVEINILLLDAIKKIPKYAKFLKELCVHKRKKMKGWVELGGIELALTRNDEFIAKAQQALPKKYQDPKIFFVPCTIGDYTFADAMLDLGASINVMPTSICKSLNFGDLEPTRMTIQLANRSFVQPFGVLEDVLVQVNELIFPTDF